MPFPATLQWKSHRITLNSATLGDIKVTASVIHPSRPGQLKGNSCPRLQVCGGSLGGGIMGILFITSLWFLPWKATRGAA